MAGMGKRMRPHTLTVPKPLVPIAGKPIVQRLVEDIAKVCAQKVDEVAFIIGNFGKETEVETKALILELLDFVDDVVDELGSRHILNYVHTIFQQGTGADRQLAVFNKNQNLIEVVDYIQDQFLRV